MISPPAYAESISIDVKAIDTVWLALASALVFFMQAGFALLESGSSRSKNCINVVMKNYMDVCIGSIIFWAFGFGLMFGVNKTGWLGTSGFFLNNANSWDYTFLLFQTMFAATAATITSGAIAERTKFVTYLVLSVAIMGLIYPVFGSWAWGSFYAGQGWLAEKGFIDFAGSTVVHAVGGWCALAAVIVLGPRLGRFDPQTGEAREIPGHNLNYVALGGFILWFGWFGFNGGSTLAADVSIGLINLNTQLAAAAGAAGACLLSKFKDADSPLTVHIVVNGSLAGLVSITAGCASMEPVFAIMTGFCGGLIYLSGSWLLLRFQLDDVVHAVSVHAFAGTLGTIFAGIFYKDDPFNFSIIAIQFLGVATAFLWAFGGSLVLFYIINKALGLRSDTLHEQRGLDFTEHAEVAYPEFIQASYYKKSNFDEMQR